MLRSINPREASLFDEAAGIVLRFRLGGASFPPLIYYKIFTKAPLCDVNAFAPRDYVKSKMYHNASTVNNWGGTASKSNTQQHMSQLDLDLGNKTKTVRRGGDGRSRTVPKKRRHQQQSSIRVGRSQFATKYADEDGDNDSGVEYSYGSEHKNSDEVLFAYQREENNGWRSVTLEILIESDEDPMQKKMKHLQDKFHYSRQVRKEDKLIARKKKKRKWMMNMYREGLAKERPEVLAAAAGRGGGDLELHHNLEVDFNGEHWEEEAKHLLEWSEELDFDAYCNDWSSIGTSENRRHQVNDMIEEMSRSSLLEGSDSSLLM